MTCKEGQFDGIELPSRVISKIENPQIVLLILLELPLGTLRYQKKFQLDI